MDEEVKNINDVEEDKREAEESIKDLEKGEDTNEVKDDIAEDEREEGESIEDLKKQIEELKFELEKVTRERDEAHETFLGQGKEIQKERNFKNLSEDIK